MKLKIAIAVMGVLAAGFVIWALTPDPVMDSAKKIAAKVADIEVGEKRHIDIPDGPIQDDAPMDITQNDAKFEMGDIESALPKGRRRIPTEAAFAAWMGDGCRVLHLHAQRWKTLKKDLRKAIRDDLFDYDAAEPDFGTVCEDDRAVCVYGDSGGSEAEWRCEERK